MPKDQSFHDYVVNDVLVGISGITSRAMFGGWGIYPHTKKLPHNDRGEWSKGAKRTAKIPRA